ncbi:hypothetical protein [Nonomuraea sp. NPDC050310]|uniref:hypothetical protein n=1 Tax=Nonomuraea sp. NPDC050310 TaxID=3154935 RepID=UPI0033F3AE12
MGFTIATVLTAATLAAAVPDGFLIYERADAPAPVIKLDGGEKWQVSRKARGAQWVNPCADARLGAKGRTSVRKAVLHGPAAAQLEEVAFYRNAKAAERAMDDLRRALRRCARVDDGSGVGRDLVWTATPAQVGDEGLKIAAQGYQGTQVSLHGQRAVVARRDRAVFVYAHADEAAAKPRPQDFRRHLKDAATTAARLR